MQRNGAPPELVAAGNCSRMLQHTGQTLGLYWPGATAMRAWAPDGQE